MTDGAAPNITGGGEMFYSGTGAFVSSSSVHRYVRGGDSSAYQTKDFTFDASRSSSVYGANNTTKIVTSGTAVYICIRY